MREESRQIFQTGVKGKSGNEVKDSHPSLSAERGSSGPSSRPGSLASARRPGGPSPCSGRLQFGKCPHVLLSFFFFFLLYIE